MIHNGYKFTEGEKAAPARKRFTDPQAVFAVYDDLKTEDVHDALRRAKIRTAVEGGLPYSAEQLRSKGLAYMTNLNFYGLKGVIDSRAESIMKLSTDTCDLIELTPLSGGAAGPDDERVADVIASEVSALIRREGHTIPTLATANRETDMYGLGPVAWPNDEAFAPESLERGQLKFRGDGPSVSSDHDLFMFESELPASYVFRLLDNESWASAAGWDVTALKRLVVDVYAHHKNTENDSRSLSGLSPWESELVRIRSNTFYEHHQFDKFQVLHVYVREMGGEQGITHIIVPGSDRQEKNFLYYKENAFENMDQCMVWIPYTVSERYARSIRGLATYLVPIERVSDRLTGAIIDSAFRTAKLTLQQSAPGANPAVSLTENGNTTIIAAGLDPVPNANGAANLQSLTNVRQFVSQVGVGAVAGTDLAPVSTGFKVQGDGQQISKAEAEIQERKRTARDEALFNTRVTYHDKIFAEIFRRIMKIVNGPKVLLKSNPLVKDFIDRCERRGVTPEMFKEVPDRFMVTTCRDLMLGAEAKYQLLGQILQVTAGNLDEAGRRNVTHDMYKLRFGRKAADRYTPVVSRDQSPSDQGSLATVENSLIKELKPVLVGQDQWHWSHIPVHSQVLQEIQETVQQGLAEAQGMMQQGQDVQTDAEGNPAPQVDDPEQLAKILEAASQHIQQHLQIGAQQLGMKQRASQITEMLKGLAPTIRALNLAIATQRRVREAEQEKAQREREALEKQASEAEMQRAMAKIQADKEVGMAKVQADKEVDMARVQSEREVNAGKLQNDREHRMGQLGIETESARARAANEMASVRAGIENRKAESDASIEATRRSQQVQEEISARQQQNDTARAALETFRRSNSVMGRTTVSPAQVASQQTPSFDTGELPV